MPKANYENLDESSKKTLFNGAQQFIGTKKDGKLMLRGYRGPLFAGIHRHGHYYGAWAPSALYDFYLVVGF